MGFHDEYSDALDDRNWAHSVGHGGWHPGRAPRPYQVGDRGGLMPAALGFTSARQLFDAITRGDWTVPEPSRFPSEPPEGSVLKWVKTFPNGGRSYTYVALRASNRWYLTGKHTAPMAWDELVEHIGDSPCELAPNDWSEIPQLTPGPMDGLSPEEWFMAAYPQDYVTAEPTEEGQG